VTQRPAPGQIRQARLIPTDAQRITVAGLALDEGRARAGWANGRAVEVVVTVAPSSGAAATARLPDPRRSYAVLIGSSRYGPAELSDLPAVAGNLAGLAEVLTDPALGGFPPDRCIVVPDPASAAAAGRTLTEYAARAEDTLLIYWAGHGWPGPGEEFHLSMTGHADGLPAGALPVGRVRDALLRSPAAHRILILDCCFSGGVVPVTGVTWALLGQAAIEGVDVLVSAPPSPVYFSRPRETYTVFTGALIAIMRDGIPGGPEFLTLGTIYGQLLYALASRGLPRPQQAGTGTAGQLALARNPAFHRRPQDAGPEAGHQPPQAARGRRRLTALAAAAVLGTSMLLAAVTQRQAGHAPQADPRPASAISFGQASLSEPVSFTVDVTPAAVLDPATRSQAISRIISSLDRQLTARRLLDRRVGLVQIFASGAITGIARSEGAARLVLESIQQRSRIFAAAGGQSFWTGTGGYFTFQIYFLR
jgi:Caspase domain